MKVAFIIDNIKTFDIKKDTTYMMMKAVEKEGWEQSIFTLQDIFVKDGVAFGKECVLELTVDSDSGGRWYNLIQKKVIELHCFSVIFMRKDPPLNMDFIYATYILELAEKRGSLIVNKPSRLRDFNEKFIISQYPEFAPKTIVSQDYCQIKDFIQEQKDVIIKPLDNMGGQFIFRVRTNDTNMNVILETATNFQSRFVMVQKYDPSISFGDKRVLIVNGEPLPYLAARIPNPQDGRGNIAAGASVLIQPLSAQDQEISSVVGDYLKSNKVLFAGIDIIGSHLTEINITSPTMAQQIYRYSGINAADLLIKAVKNIVCDAQDC